MSLYYTQLMLITFGLEVEKGKIYPNSF